ncbi:AT hook motif family protein [Trichomonas vaginalis G3]|uniref:AT hook motif family protein n=1 Tax=Trichomonas vaginalis (strain ATCC PRA-98 / G3) TaxID=412133 RepID=A2DHG0_TRIV3|nr:helicase protein [Trichomonas vaginalis G3]EAY20233.1 AT hook motif family protein [Trichomonas vaginalis G3]KAI5507728.1 helicase protein [Trichomonas vaginalis G3]|eukprot:XP_001581219.1 AT hook motif family protein [Trichomonas vaginalis G3]
MSKARAKLKPKNYTAGTVDGSIAERKRSEMDSKEITVQNYNRVVKIQESDQSSDGEFIPQKREDGESNPEADSDETLSDDQEDDPYQQQEKDIDQILCLTNDKPRPGFLAFRINQSLIRSKIYQDYQLTSELQTKKMNDFKKSTNSGLFISNLNPELTEPLSSPLTIDCLFIYRIISHKSNQNVALLTSEMLDKKNVICGYPMDTLPPIDHMKVFTTPLQNMEDTESSFLSSDGVFHINNSKSRDETEKDGFLIAGDADAYFLVKWKGLGEEDATWENYNTIYGLEPSLFCAANMADFKRMTKIYWKNTIEMPTNTIVENFDPSIEPLPLMHGIELTEAQLNAYKFIMEKFSKNETAVIRVTPTAGRTMSVAAFLNTAVNKLNHKKPAIIITDHVNSWYTTFTIATDLYVVDYSCDKMSRNIIINKEMVGDNHAKFDVLIITPDVLVSSTESIGSVKWEFIVMDKLEEFKLPHWLTKTPSHKIYFFDYSLDTITIPQKKFGILEMNPPENPYKEEIWVIPDVAADVIFKYLKKLLKGKPYRHYDFFSLSYLLQTAYSHPFLIPELRELIISLENDDEEEEMSKEDKIELMGDASEKFICVLHLALEAFNEGKVVVVVCNGFNIMRLLKEYLDEKDIPSAFLNSPLTSECYHEDFTKGVLFMTREFNSREYEKLDIKTVIFYDINDELWKDLILGDFMRMKYNATIIRLLTKDSIELLYFGHLLEKGEFECHNLERNTAETYVRYGIMSTAPWRKSQDMDYTKIYVTYPNDNKELIENFLNTPRSNINIEFSFWSTCFTKEDKSLKLSQENKEQIDTSQWTSTKGRELLDAVMRYGLFNWTQIARSVSKHVDDAKLFAITLLALMSGKVTSGNYTYLNYYLASNLKLNCTPKDPAEWRKNAKKIKNLHRELADQVLKENRTFGSFEKFLEGANQKIITDAYKSFSNGQFPRRYATRKNDFPSLEEFNEIINGSRPITRQTMPLYNCVINDVLSMACHYEKHTPPLDFIRDVINNFENDEKWTDSQVNRVFQMLQNYGIPTDDDGKTDPLEVIALCEIFDKLPDDITSFVEGFLLEILKFQHGQFSLVIPKKLTHNELVIEILAEKILQHRSKIIAMMAARRCVNEPKQVNYNLTNAGPNWTNETDVAMFQFACQYGLDQARIYFDAKTSENYKGADVKCSKSTINKLNAILPARPSISRRIAFIVQTVATTARPSSRSLSSFKDDKNKEKEKPTKSKKVTQKSKETEEEDNNNNEEEEENKTNVEIERNSSKEEDKTEESESSKIDIQSDEPLSENNIPTPPDTSEEEKSAVSIRPPTPPPPKEKPKPKPKQTSPKEKVVYEKMQTRSMNKKATRHKKIHLFKEDTEEYEEKEEQNKEEEKKERTPKQNIDIITHPILSQYLKRSGRGRGRPPKYPIPVLQNNKTPTSWVLPPPDLTKIKSAIKEDNWYSDILLALRRNQISFFNLFQFIREGEVSGKDISRIIIEAKFPQNILIQLFREHKVSDKNFFKLLEQNYIQPPTLFQMLIELLVPQTALPQVLSTVLSSLPLNHEQVTHLTQMYPQTVYEVNRIIERMQKKAQQKAEAAETNAVPVKPPELPGQQFVVPTKHPEPKPEKPPEATETRKPTYTVLPPPPMENPTRSTIPEPIFQPPKIPQIAQLPPPPFLPQIAPNNMQVPIPPRFLPVPQPLPGQSIIYVPVKRGRGRPPGSKNKQRSHKRAVFVDIESTESSGPDDEVTELPKTRAQTREEENENNKQ